MTLEQIADRIQRLTALRSDLTADGTLGAYNTVFERLIKKYSRLQTLESLKDLTGARVTSIRTLSSTAETVEAV